MESDSESNNSSDNDFGEIDDELDSNVVVSQECQQQTPYKQLFIVAEVDRTTINTFTRYEFSNVIGKRAAMIQATGIHYAKGTEQSKTLDARKIAQIELLQKRCPLILRRIIGNRAEDFDVNYVKLPNVNIDVWEYVNKAE